MTGEGSWPSVDSFEELVDGADLFVIGEVTNVAPSVGPDDVLPDVMPSTNSTMLVTSILAGHSETAQTITVSQTGGLYWPAHMIEDHKKTVAPLPPDADPGASPRGPASIAPLYFLELADDPLFRFGERVAIALDWNPTLSAYVLATGPQSRFSIDENDRVHPVAHSNEVVAPLDGITVADLAQRVAAAAN